MTSFDSHPTTPSFADSLPLHDKANQRLGWAIGGSLLGNVLLWRLVSAIASSHPAPPSKPIEITRLIVSAKGTRTVKVVNHKAVARRVAQLKRSIAAHPETVAPRVPPPQHRAPSRPQPVRPRTRIVAAPNEKAVTNFHVEPTAAPQTHSAPTSAPDAPTSVPSAVNKPRYAANSGARATRSSHQGSPNGSPTGPATGSTSAGDPNGARGKSSDAPSTGTATATAAPTDPPAPTATPRPQPTNTPVPAPTATPKPEPTNTPRPAPTNTPKPAPTNTPRPAPTAIPKPKGATRDATATKQVDVDIPDDLKEGEFKKSVRVRVDVAADGSSTPSLRGSSGNTQVDNLVLAALKRWKWKPALKDGDAIASTQYFRFDIEVRRSNANHWELNVVSSQWLASVQFYEVGGEVGGGELGSCKATA